MVNYYTLSRIHSNELAHHGILGMKWGVRRYQPYPSDYVGKGKYIGKSSTTSGKRPTLREDIRDYAKAKHALERAHGYSEDRRIANRAERLQKGFVRREQRRYDRALRRGKDRKIEEHGLKLDMEKKTQEGLKTLQQELTNQIHASFVTARRKKPIATPVKKFFEGISDILSDIPIIPVASISNLKNTYAMRRVVQNAIEESNIMGKKVDDVIQLNLRAEISNIKMKKAAQEVNQ